MALMLMQGFDSFGDAADMSADPRISINSTPIITTGRFGGKAGTLNSSADDIYLHAEGGNSVGTTVYCGFALKINSNPASTNLQVGFYAKSGSIMWYLYLTNLGQIQFRRQNTVLGTGSETLTIGSWNYVVIKVLISDTVGTVETWVNGTKDLDLTNQDTDNGAGVIGIVHFNGMVGVTSDFDDVYLGDSDGTDMTDEQGDCRIEMLTPDANGTTNNFTASPAVANYLNVDDGGTPDDDTTYNHSSTATHKELYACSNIVGNIDTVHAVQVAARIRKEDAGNREFNLICRNNVTEVDSGAKGLSTDYVHHTHIYENDPDGGGNWTEADVNAMEIGLEIST